MTVMPFKRVEHAVKTGLASFLGLAFFVSLLACGGGFASMPSPTNKTVKLADLVGVWTYKPDVGVSVELTLNADGSYVQNVTLPHTIKRASGMWEIRDSDIAFDAAFTAFGGWQKPEPETWMIIDSLRTPSGFAVFGGAKDPDLWMEMSWSALSSKPSAASTP